MKTMLSAALLQRVTDSDEITPLVKQLVLAHWPTASVKSAHVSRVMPKPTGEIVIQYLIQYDVQNDSGLAPQVLYGQHFPDAVDALVHQHPAAQWIDSLRLRLWPFPEDPELDHLRLINDPDEFHRTYDSDLENVGYAGLSMGTPARVMGYRLGRRCVARIGWQSINDDGGPPKFPKNDIVIKMGRKRQTLALWTRWRQLENEGFAHFSADGIGIPKSLFCHSDTGALFQDCVHEPPLHEMLGTGVFPGLCERAAQTLAKLHSCRIPGLRGYSASQEFTHLCWLVGVTGETFPAIANRLRALLTPLEDKMPVEDTTNFTTSHRDFYDKQLLAGESRVYLLDCDTLAMADPALDYGNFAAHLVWRRLQHPEHAETISQGLNRFLDTYHDTSRSFQKRADWWTKSALLRLACIYTWRPRWRPLAARFVESDESAAPVAIGGL